MNFLDFFREDNGMLSSARLYTFVALVTAVILTFTGGTFELIVTYLTAAFTGKVVSKLGEAKVSTK